MAVLGIVLLVTGVGALGAATWEFYGTTVLAQRAAEREVEAIRQQWQASPAEADPDAGEAPLVAPPTPGEAAWLLRIPRLGDDYEKPIVAGIGSDDLKRGVGWYPESALPGEVGNLALAGHRISRGEPFRHILELDVGDQIVIETQGAIFTYEINSAPREVTVQDTDSWVLLPVPGQPDVPPHQAVITLTTGQDFIRSSDRSVGFGILINTGIKQ